MNAVDALKDAGFVFCPNVMQPEFDYPLDFWERERDGLRILGNLEFDGDTHHITLCPYNEWADWYIEGEVPEGFVADFILNFERLAPMCKDI